MTDAPAPAASAGDRARALFHRVRHRARASVAPTPPAASPADEGEYRAFTRASNTRNGRLLFFGIGAGNMLWWLSDAVVYRGQDLVLRQFGTYRPIVSLGALLAGLLLSRDAPLTRVPVLVLATAGSALSGLTAWVFGTLGGPSQPWFHFLHLAPMASALVACSFGTRVVALLGLYATLVLAYFGPHPHYLRDPHALAALSYLGFATAVGLVAGVLSERTRRAGFLLRRALARQAGELQALNDQLEDRVRDKTAQLRALATHLETALEEERRRVARELHDALGQELAATRYGVARAQQRHARDPAALTAQDLAAIDEQLARTAATTREILMDLRPRVLDDLGLVAAVEWLAQRAEARMGLACEIDAPAGGDLALDPVLATAAFRVVQESLTNAGRHAEPTRVQVALYRDADALHVAVRDDGRGFDPPAAEATPGRFGLLGMRERVRALGGDLRVESAPGRGTTVRARLPLARAAEVPS